MIPMNSAGSVANQTVLVEGEKIVAIGPAGSIDVPDGSLRIGGQGRYLLPGLAEMHGHVPPPSSKRAETEAVLFLYLSNGITTVRGMLGSPGQLDLREDANSGLIDSPTLYLAGPSFNGRSVSSPRQAEEMVSKQKSEGWNLLKVHPGPTRDEYDAMARTANTLEIRFGGHVPEDVGLIHALEMNQETFDHLDGYLEYLEGDKPLPDSAFDAIAIKTREAGAWVVPTLALWETLLGHTPLDTLQSYDELRYVSKGQVRQWSRTHEGRKGQNPPELIKAVVANRLKLLKALDRNNVKILMGTDAPQQFSVPGFSLHRELERMSAAGLSNEVILVSGTRNVGEYFANEDDFGTVETGKRADLLLVDANPLDDIGNLKKISGVMARGRWYSREALDARLAEIEKMYAER